MPFTDASDAHRRSGLLSALLSCLLTAQAANATPSARDVLSKIVDPVTGSYRETHAEYARRLPEEYANGARTVTRITLPAGRLARTAEGGRLDWPDGTLVSKEFSYPVRSPASVESDGCAEGQVVEHGDPHGRGAPRCLLELRVLYRHGGRWLPRVFVRDRGRWEPAPTGRFIHLSLRDGRALVYEVPGISDCRTCHLGARQRPDFGPIGLSATRLEASALVALSGREAGPDSGAPAVPARRYLDTNCGYCHSPHGLGSSSGLFLDLAETDPRRLGICKRPIAFGRVGEGGRYDIEPGHPERSLLIRRMASVAPGIAMPEAGRGLVDLEGVGIVSAWIAKMTRGCGDGV
jgi:hypothetical protein